MNNEIRQQQEEEAKAYYKRCLLEIMSKRVPKGQKYPPGARVFISNKMPPWMNHFDRGVIGTVEYTYTHMFRNPENPDYDDLKNEHSKEYSINIDGQGSVAWYGEDLLTRVK